MASSVSFSDSFVLFVAFVVDRSVGRMAIVGGTKPMQAGWKPVVRREKAT